MYARFSMENPSCAKDCLLKLEACLHEVKHWMGSNRLKLNASKTKFMVISSAYHQKKHSLDKLVFRVDDEIIKQSRFEKNLGSYLDNTLNMEKEVAMTVRSMYYHLRKVAKIRWNLDHNTCARVINAIVTSRLDFNNGILLGMPAKLSKRLQLAQNHAAKLLMQKRKCDHVSPLLVELHWLPVNARVKFKVLVTVYKCLKSATAPSYLSQLLQMQNHNRTLRSSQDRSLLTVPKSKKSNGDRSFSVFAPKCWNLIPRAIRESETLHMFKRNLKTFLFKACYDVN